jgi:hypothetical protein
MAARVTRVAPKKFVYASNVIINAHAYPTYTHFKHVLSVRHRHRFNFSNTGVTSIVVYDIDPPEYVFGLFERGLDIFFVPDINLYDEQPIWAIFCLEFLHQLGFTNGRDDSMPIREEELGH